MKAVTGREMCRALQRQGWVLDHIRSSHHIDKKAGHQLISVPVHSGKTLKPGTQHGIMKKARLTDDDL